MKASKAPAAPAVDLAVGLLDQPSVAEVGTRREAIHADLTRARAAEATYTQVTDPHHAQHLERRVTAEEFWTAQQQLPVAARERAELELAARAVDVEFDGVLEATRGRLLATLGQQKADAVQRLAAALRTAADVNAELIALEERERGVQPGGVIADVWAWPELIAGPDSRLGHWLATLRKDYGIDCE